MRTIRMRVAVASLSALAFALIPLPAVARDVLVLGPEDYVFDAGPTVDLSSGRIVLEKRGVENPAHEIVSGLYDLTKGSKFPFEVRTSRKLRNGIAVIHKGTRYIIYDPAWYESNKVGTAGSVLVLGHEVGHHICGHTAGKMQLSPHEAELEADRYLGAALRRIEEEARQMGGEYVTNLKGVTSAAVEIFPVGFTRSHPSREQRIAAIVEGYQKGSPCEKRGVLVPDQITNQDVKGWKADHRRQCDQWAQEWCRIREIDMKRIMYQSLKIGNCISRESAKSYSSNGRSFVVFENVDCAGRGQIKEGAFTKVEIKH